MNETVEVHCPRCGIAEAISLTAYKQRVVRKAPHYCVDCRELLRAPGPKLKDDQLARLLAHAKELVHGH